MWREFLLTMLVVFPVAARGQDRELPPIVREGFEILLVDGSDDAIDHWMAAWESEDDLLKKAQLKSGFNQILEMTGDPVTYEIVEAQWVGSLVVSVYGVLGHRRQPLYVALTAYHAPDGWMVSSLNANTSMGDVFPDWLLAAWIGGGSAGD